MDNCNYVYDVSMKGLEMTKKLKEGKVKKKGSSESLSHTVLMQQGHSLPPCMMYLVM